MDAVATQLDIASRWKQVYIEDFHDRVLSQKFRKSGWAESEMLSSDQKKEEFAWLTYLTLTANRRSSFLRVRLIKHIPKPNFAIMGVGGQHDQGGDTYVCNLPEEVQKVALEELREDASIREQSLDQMREWINKHPNIKQCRTDTLFLLRFLRTKKFSVPQACEMLERYLTIRQLYPQWFQKLDCEDPDVADVVNSGYLVPLLDKDRGRTVIFSNVGRFDPHKHTSATMARVHSMITETLCDDEVNQVQGYTYINDESGFSMAHISLWSLLDVRNMLRCIQHSTPMRHKANHFINIPSTATKFLEFAISLLSEKLKSRIKIHKSMEELHADIDPKILPKEYGGTVPLADMVEELKKKLKEKRDVVVGLDDMCIEINKDDCKLLSEMNEELGLGIDGSFKKLTVD